MAGAANPRKIDDLLEKISESLKRRAIFEAERMAAKALAMARQEEDFARMAQIIKPLWNARQQRMEAALDLGKVRCINEPITEDMKIKPGCYMVQPPQVGAEARRFRLAAMQGEVNVAVLCREPLTRSGMVPVVAISPGSTLRVRVPPPADASDIDLEWFAESIQALGDEAIESLDPELPIIRRIDALLEFLDALPEHEAMHQALEEACRRAHEEQAANASAAQARSAAKAKIKSQAAASED